MNRPVAIAIATKLLQCDIAFAEVDLLTNTLEQREIMTRTDKQKLEDAFREIQKRDDLVHLWKQAVETEEKINKELRTQLVKERRRKGLWKFGGVTIGVVGTVLFYNATK
jgi:glutamate synthase domain-containing protein 3